MKSEPQDKEKKVHIKKPLNAFMLFMKDQRAKVVAECTLKESAAINQILGESIIALRPLMLSKGRGNFAFSHLYKRVCLSVRPSVRPSVRYIRVRFLRKGISGPNLNKIATGTSDSVIGKTIKRQVR